MIYKPNKINMIAILNNLINLPIFFINIMVANIIHLLITPAGFVALFSSIIFLGDLTIKSIAKDFNKGEKPKKVKKMEKCSERNIPGLPTASCV
jgi:hypothetical protein